MDDVLGLTEDGEKRRKEERKEKRAKSQNLRVATGAARTSAIFGPGWAARAPLHRPSGPKRGDQPITDAAFRVPGSETFFRFLVLSVGNSSLRYGLGNSAAIDNAIISLIVISKYLQYRKRIGVRTLLIRGCCTQASPSLYHTAVIIDGLSRGMTHRICRVPILNSNGLWFSL